MTIEEALDRSLDEIRFEGASVNECLARYPEYADRLRPLLQSSARLAQAPEVRPNRQFKARLRNEFAPPPRRGSLFSFRSLSLLLVLLIAAALLLIWVGANWNIAGLSFNQLLPELPMLKAVPGQALHLLGAQLQVS